MRPNWREAFIPQHLFIFMLGSLTSFQLVTNSLKFQRESFGQAANAIPDSLSIVVQEDSIECSNIARRSWSELVNKVSYLKRLSSSSSGTTVKDILQTLKDYCVDGKRSNRGLGSRAIVSSLLGANASQMGSCQTLTFRDACCRIQSPTIADPGSAL